MNSNTMSLTLVVCSLAVISTAIAAPSGLPLAVSAPIVAPAPVTAVVPAPVVTAYSSQYVARNYNGIAVAPAVVPSAAYLGYPQVNAPAASYTAGLPLIEEYLFK